MKRYVLYKDNVKIGCDLTFEALQVIINNILDECDSSNIVNIGVAEEKYYEENIIMLLNNLIEAAVKNGADAGGSYNQNMSEFYSAIEKLLDIFELTNYEIVETGNINCYSPYKIELAVYKQNS